MTPSGTKPSAYLLKQALAFADAGNLGGAIQALSQAVSLDPGSVECLSALADAYQRAGFPEHSLAAFMRLEGMSELTLDERLRYSEVFLALVRIDEAVAQADIAVKMDPRHVRARLIRASLYQYKGDHSRSEADLRTAIDLDINHPGPYYALTQGRKFTEEDRPLVESMRRIIQARKASPYELARLNLALGHALDNLGEYEDSMGCFDEANRLFRSVRKAVFDVQRQSASINKIIETFHPDSFEKHCLAGISSGVPLFIVGMPRSGTTLAEQILSSHSEIFGAGELLFWINEGIKALGPTMEIRDDVAATLARAYLAVLQAKAPNALRIIDKLPYNYLWLGLIHICFPNARIVHCRRHPVDTCLSIYSSVFQSDPPFAHDKDNIVAAYRLYAKLMAHWRRVLPGDRFFELEYEELVRNPEQLSRQMIQFCGLPWEEACLRPEQNERPVATTSHWQVRQPVYKTSLERWRRFEPWLGAFRSLIDDPPEE